MKTLIQLSEEVNALKLENATFVVQIREDNDDNTGDANYSENKSFDTLEEAFEDYQNEVVKIKTFEGQGDSEFKTVELYVTDNIESPYVYELLESENYRWTYSEDDYGKFLISYRPTNNGIEGVNVEIIDKYTPSYVNGDGRYSTKFQVKNTKEEAIKLIYNEKLYISMDDATEIFESFISDEL